MSTHQGLEDGCDTIVCRASCREQWLLSYTAMVGLDSIRLVQQEARFACHRGIDPAILTYSALHWLRYWCCFGELFAMTKSFKRQARRMWRMEL